MPSPIPTILLIDDEPRRHALTVSRQKERATIIPMDPRDVALSDIATADLISVDEDLGADWRAEVEQRGLSAAVMNQDGLSVAAGFSGIARVNGHHVAISVHTGKLQELAPTVPSVFREAQTAELHDLEWVFSFGSEDFGDRLVALAGASLSAKSGVARAGGDFGATWLQLVGSATWAELAQAQIEDCRPPAHFQASGSGGRTLVRWLAQRVIPYPTFLLSDAHAANKLGISTDSFRSISDDPRFSTLKYVGPLADFSGHRWWRAGLDGLLEQAGVNAWDPPAERVSGLSAIFDGLEPLKSERPVVAYSRVGEIVSTDAEAASSVRIQFDGWPVFADDAWAEIATVASDDELAALVATGDRSQLG